MRMSELLLSQAKQCILTVIGHGEADIKLICWRLPQWSVDDIRVALDKLISDGAVIEGDIGFKRAGK